MRHTNEPRFWQLTFQVQTFAAIVYAHAHMRGDAFRGVNTI